MNKLTKTTRSGIALISLLVLAPSASASSLLKKIKKVGDKATHAVTKTADQAANTATKVADTTANQAKSMANSIKNTTFNKYGYYTQQDFNKLLSQAQKTAADASAVAKEAYQDAVLTYDLAMYDAAKLREAARAFIDKNKPALNGMQQRISHLSGPAQAALTRIHSAIATGATATKGDLDLVVNEITSGFNVYGPGNWSYSFFLSTAVGVGTLGGEQQIGLAYSPATAQVASFVSYGAAIGGDAGLDVQLGFAISPQGPFSGGSGIGLGLGGVLDNGMGLAFDWGLPMKNFDPSNYTPSVTLAMSTGEGGALQASPEIGYTHVHTLVTVK